MHNAVDFDTVSTAGLDPPSTADWPQLPARRPRRNQLLVAAFFRGDDGLLTC
jgi:hypothetical protein